MEVTFVFASNLTVADHRGYCSGDECEDEVSQEYRGFIVELTKKQYDVLTDSHKPKNIFKNRLGCLQNIEGSVGGGSGYCGSSELGLKHEYRLKLTLKDVITLGHYKGSIGTGYNWPYELQEANVQQQVEEAIKEVLDDIE